MTHYDTLGVAPDADGAEIKRAYRRAARKHHPDRGGDAARMAQVNAAFETLSSPDRRLHYDRTGKDRPTDVELKARAWIATEAISWMQSAPDHQNLIDDLRNKILGMQAQQLKAKAQLTEAIKRLRLRAKRLKRKAKGIDIIGQMIAAHIAQIEQQANGADENLLVQSRVVEILEGYEFEGAAAGTFVMFFA